MSANYFWAQNFGEIITMVNYKEGKLYIENEELGNCQHDKGDLVARVLNKACQKYGFEPARLLIFKGMTFDTNELRRPGSNLDEVAPIVHLEESGTNVGYVIDHLLGKELIPGIESLKDD